VLSKSSSVLQQLLEPPLGGPPATSHDILAEGAIGLTAGARAVPAIDGKHPSPSTMWRWCRIGLNGVKLQYARVGRRIVTSKPAIARFADAVAAADRPVGVVSPITAPAAPRKPTTAEKAIKTAETILSAAGI
jgi:hypothetical protein